MKQRRADATSEQTVRVGGALAIPAVLRSLGTDPADVLAEAGLNLQLFDDPDNLISYAARSHLIRLCVERTGCEHFGLLVGQRGSLSSLGLVGYLAQHSTDVGTALRNLVRFMHLHTRSAVLTLRAERKLALFGYAGYSAEAADQIADGAMATAFNIMCQLCGPEWKPVEVLLAHRKPVDSRPFRQFFQAPLRFDAGENALIFSADWLDRPVAAADPELRRLLQKQIDALGARNKFGFPEQVRGVLRTSVQIGHLNADDVAALFSMHSRTLNRRLADFGTSFRKLADETRYEVARQMLMTSTIEVSEIATALDYADASAFTRAFRRWSGTTPALWRKKQTSHPS
jgi:AraC-like DNA-binding protein